jgi:3',5'-nucleoside bisphosphate phosphatase
MTIGQPFTALCQQLARGPRADRADLHMHSTYSDGMNTPEELVNLARRCGLAAIALTDHDTVAGLAPARRAAVDTSVEVISGVEITCEYRNNELHLLAYFFDPENAALLNALERIRAARVERFHEMIERLRQRGVSIEGEGPAILPSRPDSLGRRHLAELLVRQGKVSNIREAFSRYLGERGGVIVPKIGLPIALALDLVRRSGGVAAWAHPAYDCTRETLSELRSLGLSAVEAEYPDTRSARIRELRAWAAELGLAVSGGSDCHGPGRRSVGACSITLDELEALRRMARGGAC